MKSLIFSLALATFSSSADSKTLFDFSSQSIEGKKVVFSKYKEKAKAYLIVNTASKCGYTGQYEGLQKLYKNNKDKGLIVLGFPSNDFGGQEPENNKKIKKFCKLNYGVTFPLFEKGPVVGKEAQALFKWLTKEGGPVRWNFEKFLLNKDGKLVKRFPSKTTPESSDLTTPIAKLLK